MLGEYGNKNIIIRRQRGNNEPENLLLKKEIDDPLAVDQPTRFVIEITTGKLRASKGNKQILNSSFRLFFLICFGCNIDADGIIRVYSEVDNESPLVEVQDTKRPLKVKYMSFAVYEPATAEFFYDCNQE